MELKIKSLLEYMDKAKDELNNLREERKKLSKEKESFSNKETSFYKDVELSYNKKSEEYDAYVKLVSDKVKSKKKEILEGYSEKMDKLNGTNNKLKEDYAKIKSLREEVNGKKAQLKWLETTIPTEGEINKSNREFLRKLKDNIEDLEVETKMIDAKIKANQEILEELVPKDKTPMSVYKELQEETQKIESLDFNNLDETKEFFESKQQSVPEQKQVEQKVVQQSAPEQKPVEQKVVQQNVPEQKQVQQKVVQQNVLEQKQVQQKVVQQSVPEQRPVQQKVVQQSVPEQKQVQQKVVQQSVPEQRPVQQKVAQQSMPEQKPEVDKEEKVSITLDAESGKVIFEKYFKDEAGETRHFIDKYSRIESIFNNRKEIMKAYRQYFKEHNQKDVAKLLKKLDKKLNPAVLKILFENQEPELFSNYIVAVRDGNKDLLSFDYNINLENPYLVDKSYINLNKQALIDNSNMGTKFEAVKSLKLKTLLSKLPKNARFVQKWIGKLPQPNRVVREENMTDDQKKLLEESEKRYKEIEKRDKYEAYMTAKKERMQKEGRDMGGRGTTEEHKKFINDLNYAAKNGIIYQEEKNGSEQKREPKQETIER